MINNSPFFLRSGKPPLKLAASKGHPAREPSDKMKTLDSLRRTAGLPRCNVSAKQLRATNPALASRWADHLKKNHAAIAKALSAAIR